MLARSDALIIPSMLPDGRIVFDEHRSAERVVEMLREYDPRCSLVRNALVGQWEVWRRPEDGDRPVRVMSLAQDRLPHGAQLVAHLAAHDSRRTDVTGGVEKHNAALDAARDRDADDEGLNLADKLHWALSRDLHAHAPASRPMPFSGRRRA